MLLFAEQYGVTAVTLLVLALLVFFAVRKIIRDKKNGVCACGCKCANCPMHGQCGTHNADDA